MKRYLFVIAVVLLVCPFWTMLQSTFIAIPFRDLLMLNIWLMPLVASVTYVVSHRT